MTFHQHTDTIIFSVLLVVHSAFGTLHHCSCIPFQTEGEMTFKTALFIGKIIFIPFSRKVTFRCCLMTCHTTESENIARQSNEMRMWLLQQGVKHSKGSSAAFKTSSGWKRAFISAPVALPQTSPLRSEHPVGIRTTKAFIPHSLLPTQFLHTSLQNFNN